MDPADGRSGVESLGQDRALDSLISLEEVGGEQEVLPGQGGGERSTELLGSSDGDERRRLGVVLQAEHTAMGTGERRRQRSGPIPARPFDSGPSAT